MGQRDRPRDSDDKKTILKEMLLNVDHISKIEVTYLEENEFDELEEVSVNVGHKSKDARKAYQIFIGGEKVGFISDDLNDPVSQVIEGIYKNATKGLN